MTENVKFDLPPVSQFVTDYANSLDGLHRVGYLLRAIGPALKAWLVDLASDVYPTISHSDIDYPAQAYFAVERQRSFPYRDLVPIVLLEPKGAILCRATNRILNMTRRVNPDDLEDGVVTESKDFFQALRAAARHSIQNSSTFMSGFVLLTEPHMVPRP